MRVDRNEKKGMSLEILPPDDLGPGPGCNQHRGRHAEGGPDARPGPELHAGRDPPALEEAGSLTMKEKHLVAIMHRLCSKPIFPIRHSFYGILEALQDLHTFAAL